ncbi:F-box only protein 9 [Trichoplax sp. H2]|nr:F-box only protein 9 [Trichoplax sp. H2]|eukprot:RDD43671.1 F-box only protein 9 [Trichoplax sp. H2]
MEDRNLRNELLEFREKWRNEIKRNQNNIDLTLQTSPLTSHDTVRTSIRNNISGLDNNQNQESVLQVEFDRVNLNDETVQEKEIELHKAKMLYQQGIESERNGNCDAAVHYYREAIRLKPDIENCLEIEEFPGNQEIENDENNEDVEENLSNIVERFKSYTMGRTCDTEIETTAVHISVLPTEILMYIFKWVVSSEVDMRSLEQLSMVSRGFYICARDPILWRLACYKVYGELSCRTIKDFDGWREMFITKPHLRFDGIYISKMSYFRPGEKSLDNLYKPFHLVNCYRYLRFYSDGKVLSLTSSAEPTTIIPQFYRRKAAGSSTASLGYYTLTNDTVSIVVNSSPKRRSKMDKPQSQTTFTMEFTLSKPRKKFNWYLSWSKFSYQSTNRFLGRVDTGNFEINKSYTPLYFSRVKSYSIATNSLLS